MAETRKKRVQKARKTPRQTAPTAQTAPTGEAASLLAWYDVHARHLPWRARPGAARPTPPYRVWLSEIMLQQTTVVTVGPYFEKFLALWPDIEALAAAEQDEVLHAWAGLGYYSRARNLHACAQEIVANHGGVFPDQEAELLKLPGIGPYTAAAIAAIAYDQPATVMDGNVERVMARYFAVKTPLPEAKPDLKEKAAALTPPLRPGDYAQAVMDLGATICTPRAPSCSRCPLQSGCAAQALGIAETLPAKTPKKKKPTRYGAALWVRNPEGEVAIRKRPPKGLLASMMEVPSTEWVAADSAPDIASSSLPDVGTWQKLAGVVRHTFTHFHLELTVFSCEVETSEGDLPDALSQAFWVAPEALGEYAFPTVMKKIIAHAQEDQGPLFEATRRT